MPFCFVPFCDAIRGGKDGHAMCGIPDVDLVRVLQAFPFNFSRDAAEKVEYNRHTHIVCVEHMDPNSNDFSLLDVHSDPLVSAIIDGSREPQASCLRATAQRGSVTIVQLREVGTF